MIGDAQPSAPAPCPTCRNPVDVRSRHIVVRGSAVRVFCSEKCKAGRVELRREEPVRSRRKPIAWVTAAVAGGALAAGTLLWSHGEHRMAAAALGQVEATRTGRARPSAALTAEPDPDAEARAKEAALISELALDAWIHPLAGPTRRMPTRDSRVFGAERPGDRPIECGSGHCGVDIGGEIWGEPVMAVHDGVVVRVVRTPNPNRGGMYVKLAHRNHTVFTSYFHLAAIPSKLDEGDQVKMGQVIGLVGDTGVVNSGPHLHFALSVQPADPKQLEQYIDPEVLIALWPLKMPGTTAGAPAIALSSPGQIRGPFGPSRKKKKAASRKVKRAAAAKVAEAEAADEGGATAPPEAEAPYVPIGLGGRALSSSPP